MARMSASAFQAIKQNLRQLYLEDPRPWLVGFSGGKDSTMVASLIFDTVLTVSEEQRTKPVSILCGNGLPDDLLNILKDDLESDCRCDLATH